MDGLWSIRPCVVCSSPVKCEPDYPPEVRVVCWRCVKGDNLYDVALSVTDEILGQGTFAAINAGNPDPGVQAAIQRWRGSTGSV